MRDGPDPFALEPRDRTLLPRLLGGGGLTSLPVLDELTAFLAAGGRFRSQMGGVIRLQAGDALSLVFTHMDAAASTALAEHVRPAQLAAAA